MSERLRILVVDDNEVFCQNIADILDLKGYEVTTAYDGFRALELVEQNDFDLTLMDVKMPVMDGVETLKKMKKVAQDTPVIMMSAYAVEELLKEALREGAFGYLKKPLDFAKLLGLIEQVIAQGALILMVDDDQDLCANMSEILTAKGYRVSVAHDGDTAMQKSWEDNVNIMLIDLKLPPLNGLKTYLAIKDIRPNVVAIIITAYPQEMGELAQQAREEDAYAYLEKPINIDDLILLLERIQRGKEGDIFKKPEQGLDSR